MLHDAKVYHVHSQDFISATWSWIIQSKPSQFNGYKRHNDNLHENYQARPFCTDTGIIAAE